MNDAVDQVVELIFGRWRSQTLYAGVELGVFDHLDRWQPRTAATVAGQLKVDAPLLYRLLRAQAAIGLLKEDGAHGFTLTEQGELLRASHPRSLKAMARLAESPQHYALWKHLPAMVRDGKQNAFTREFGCNAFDYARQDHDYAERFKQGMSSYSALHAALILEALRDTDFAATRTFCDVAGGHGYLMCAILAAHPHLSGIVLDQPDVVADRHELWGPKLGLEDRCRYVGGDMFVSVPQADAYSLKMILHDWNDDECVQILSTLRTAAKADTRVYIAEHIVPGPGEPHFSKLFDIQMMCWGTGQERTEVQYAGLMRRAGWALTRVHYPTNRLMGVIEGVAA